MRAQEFRATPGAAGLIIGAERGICGRFRYIQRGNQSLVQQIEQSLQGQLMGLAGAGEQLVAEGQEALERRRAQQQWPGLAKTPGIADQIPVAGKALQTAQGSEIQRC